MKAVITWLEATFSSLPIPLLEVWGRFSYFVGFALALWAFGGFTFRFGHGWGFGRERQAWDARGFTAMPLTFVAIVATGYLGSFIVLVPGAQTFESLKDLVVFLCVVLFGYPALITVPFAYGLSDLVEGVPPEFLLDWLPGYFINPACFWLAYQLFGKNPDFRRARTWPRYLLFVVLFMSLEPVLWGHICSDEFTSEISYRSITPALMFTTGITWLLAPPAMLGALPLARRLGLFWAEIPGHVKERALGRKSGWLWESGGGDLRAEGAQGLPIRMFILAPFIAFVLVMVGMTAFVTLRSAEVDSTKMALRLHQEIAENIRLRLDDYLSREEPEAPLPSGARIGVLLGSLPIAEHGRALIIDRSGKLIASSSTLRDPIVLSSIENLRNQGPLEGFVGDVQYRFAHVTKKPLSRETWLTHATDYRGPSADRVDWILLTAIPESFYLAGVHAGNSRSALVFALALLLSLAVAALLASFVTAPLRRIASATEALARGDLLHKIPGSRLQELGALSLSFNAMAEQLKQSFDALLEEVEVRKRRERELEASEAKVRASESRLEELVEQRTLALERSEKRTKGILENLADGVITLDGQGIIQSFSAAASKIFGYSPEEVMGKDVARLMPEAAGADRAERVERYLSSGAGRELTGLRKDGRVFPMELTTAEVSFGAERLFAVVVRDISERKRAEEALRVAKEQADAANRAKTAFLANISHEIRTPMNAVLGFGQLMDRDSDLSSRDRERLRKILANGYHLLELINNVLEMSKIEAGRMGLNPGTFDLHAAISHVDSMVRGSIEDKGLTLTLEGVETLPRFVRSDAGKLRQILVNLLGNACKFTTTGGVRLRASAAPSGTTARLRFEVEDTGVGIAADELEKVFEPFGQTKSGVSVQTGTGLGISISRDFARLMGGELEVKSEVGRGTTFVLEVEVELGLMPETGPVDPNTRVIGFERPGPPLKVLVVDDEEDNRHVLRELLVGAGVTVAEAADGVQALRRFSEFGPDLVFMDVKMPVMDGVEATRRIRDSDGGSEVPIVILSASVFDDQRASVLGTGGNEFIAKPFREADVWGAFERLLGLRLIRRAVESRAAPEPPPLTRAQVAELGADTVSALREAVKLGYVQRVPRLLSKVGSEHARTVAVLSSLARNLEIEKLLSLL